MSFAQENLAAFMELLETQPSLFSSIDMAELEQIISPLPDDIETLSITITSWCQNHPNILNSQTAILNNYLFKNNPPPPPPFMNPDSKPGLPNGGLPNGKPQKTDGDYQSPKRGLDNQKPNVHKNKYIVDKRALLNAIQQSSSYCQK